MFWAQICFLLWPGNIPDGSAEDVFFVKLVKDKREDADDETAGDTDASGREAGPGRTLGVEL